jgi:hypothetical protein
MRTLPLLFLIACDDIDNLGFWTNGCPDWEPARQGCVAERCAEDIEAGILEEDSAWCLEDDTSYAGDTSDTSDTSDTAAK